MATVWRILSAREGIELFIEKVSREDNRHEQLS
ncbi:MAG: hypothetical protein BMS9Abin26_0726 [Gammaproteobacteria bacterium]|nr:MAG: hypothetical protein BMS9Abin26_0726 [Gammaproteobacteria bacterium]